jgi:hypothetical protein
MFLAQYESSNFLFEGAGNTEQQARVMLNKVLRHHCRNTGARLTEFFAPDEVFVREIQPGFAFLDGGEVESLREKVCAS